MMASPRKELIADCRDEGFIIDTFGSVSEFARLVETQGDEFEYGNLTVEHNAETDVHSF